MARFRDGFTYECNVSAPLTIEGQPIQLLQTARRFAARLPRGGSVEADTIDELVHNFVTQSGALAERTRTRTEHLKQLANGKLAWNTWRLDHPDVHPMFACADLRSVSTHPLDEYDFSYTNFTEANLSGLHMRRANFHQAILAKAVCSSAHFEGANFCRTDMYKTIFTDAHFEGANLQGVQLAGTELRAAHMTGCKVYGLSAWDLEVDKRTEQESLQVTYRPLGSDVDETVIVDGLDLAAFIYMTVSNRNISRVFDATGRKWVLLLGGFGERRHVLERLGRALRERQLVPIVFDFPPPKHADLIETVVLLAGMSAFVIVDITDPRSTPMELQAIAPTFAVPIVPIIQSPQSEFASFSSLRKYSSVLQMIPYTTVDDLVAHLDEWIVEPARVARQSG
jgi:hypothetical protein